MNETDKAAARILHHHVVGQGEAIVPPIVSSATFHLPDLGGHSYARAGSPTWEVLEAQLGILEGAEVVTFPSGMAAISAALMVCGAGRVILPADGYYVTRVFGQQYLAQVDLIPTRDYASEDFAGASVVFVETPANPSLDLVDIADVVARAHRVGAKVIVDNTTMTAYLQRPLDFGADLVVASDTKAPSGHSDVLFGHVAGRDADLMAKIRDWRRVSGAVPGAFEAWLVHRGVETLELRLSRMCATAGMIATRLQGHKALTSLRYLGLPDDPDHALACRQMAGFGFLIGMTFATAEAAEAFLAHCPFIVQSTSFGGVHTSGERRARWGDAVHPGFVRLSVGIEPVEVLWAAIAQALD